MIEISKSNFKYLQEKLNFLLGIQDSTNGISAVVECKIILETIKRQLDDECKCQCQCQCEKAEVNFEPIKVSLKKEDKLGIVSPQKKRRVQKVVEYDDTKDDFGPYVGDSNDNVKQSQNGIIGENSVETESNINDKIPTLEEFIDCANNAVKETENQSVEEQRPVEKPKIDPSALVVTKNEDGSTVIDRNSLLKAFWKETTTPDEYKRKVETYRSADTICYVEFTLKKENETEYKLESELVCGQERVNKENCGLNTIEMLKSVCSLMITENMAMMK